MRSYSKAMTGKAECPLLSICLIPLHPKAPRRGARAATDYLNCGIAVACEVALAIWKSFDSSRVYMACCRLMIDLL